MRLRLLSWHGTSEPRLTASCSSNNGDTAAVLLPPAAGTDIIIGDSAAEIFCYQ